MSATISRGYSFGATEQVTNAKLHSLVDSATITGIANADVASDAAIAYSKLADIDGSKLTGLANIPSGAGKIPAANITNTIDLTQIFPVGSIYLSTVSTNPNTLFGFGTWDAFGAGRMLLGNGGGYSAGATGGASTKTIAEANLPPHTHTVPHNNHTSGTSAGIHSALYNGVSDSGIVTGSVGSGTALDVLNPYIVVYMWTRSA